jgi:hypothetical protein
MDRSNVQTGSGNIFQFRDCQVLCPLPFGCFVSIYLLYSVQEEKNKKIFSFIGGEKWEKEKPAALTAAVNHLLPASC